MIWFVVAFIFSILLLAAYGWFLDWADKDHEKRMAEFEAKRTDVLDA